MIKVKKLKNGIRLVLEELPYVHSVVTGIWIKAGAVCEKPEESGISHYIEHMMFKGTEKRGPREIAADVDKTGGQINAFTGKEATCYYVRSIDDKFEETADVLTDMIENSVFDPIEMDRERTVIYEEINMNEDDPADLAHEKLSTIVFGGKNLEKSILGQKETLANITDKTIRDYIGRFYARDNIVVSVSGNFDEEKVIDYFEGKFNSLNEKSEECVFYDKGYKADYLSIKKDIEQSHICIGTEGINLEDPDWFALSILNSLFGGSMSSRLFQNIREEKGLAYSVYSMAPSYGTGGYFNIYAGVSHDKIEAASEGIREEIAKIRTGKITEEELESSREQMKATYIYGQENVAGRMFKNGKNLIISGKIHDPSDIIKSYDAVTMSDLERVKEMISELDRFSAVCVSDRERDIKKILLG